MNPITDPAEESVSVSSTARRWCVAMAAATALHVVVRVVWPVLTTDAFHDDYRQNWFWLAQVHTGVDFSATDPLTAYARAFQPPALAWVYEALARVADPYRFTKWIGLALVPAFAGALWWLGERSAPRGALGPLLVTASLVDAVWLRELMGGLSRSYGPPLQVAVVASVVADRWWLALACLAVAGLVHPQSLLLGASVVAIGAARAWRPRAASTGPMGSAAGPPLAPLVAVVLVTAALGVANARHVRGMEARFGAFLTRTEVLGSVDYGPGGRFRNERPAPPPIELARAAAAHAGVPDDLLVRVPPFAPFARQLPWAGAALVVMASVLEAVRRAAGARWRDAPWWIPVSLGVALAWNGVAHLLLPRLYFPRRFLVSAVPLALFGCCAWLLDAWVRRLEAAGRVRVRTALLSVVTAAVVISLGRFAGGPLGYRVPRGGYEGVARFLAAEPPATRYAASPRGDADTLIAIVPRRIEVASEIAHPLFTDYLEKTVRRRTRAVTRAIFPEDPARDVAALAAEGVQLLVLRRRDLGWETLPPGFAYEPVRSEVTGYWSADRQAAARAFWIELARRATAYEDDAFLVVDLRKLVQR